MDSSFSPPFGESWEHVSFVDFVAIVEVRRVASPPLLYLVFPSVPWSFPGVLRPVPGSQWIKNPCASGKKLWESVAAGGPQRRNPLQATVSALIS